MVANSTLRGWLQYVRCDHLNYKEGWRGGGVRERIADSLRDVVGSLAIFGQNFVRIVVHGVDFSNPKDNKLPGTNSIGANQYK